MFGFGSFPGGNHATSVVEGVGMVLFACYHVAIIIVLVNMLIAMMSHSFEDIQVSILGHYFNFLVHKNFQLKIIWVGRVNTKNKPGK